MKISNLALKLLFTVCREVPLVKTVFKENAGVRRMLLQGLEEQKRSEFWFNGFSVSIVTMIILVHFSLFTIWGPYKFQFPYMTHLLVVVMLVNAVSMFYTWNKAKRLRELGL